VGGVTARARRRGQRPHGVGGRAGQRQPEVAVDRLHGADRVRHQVVVAHVKEPRLIMPGALGGEQGQAAGPQVELRTSDLLAGEDRRPAG